MTLLAAFTFVQWLLALGIIGVCALLILIVLVQQASGGGLVGAFGGGGSGGAFGAKTGDIFTVITVVLASVYLLFTILGNYAFQPLAAAAPAPTVATTTPEPVEPASGGGVSGDGSVPSSDLPTTDAGTPWGSDEVPPTGPDSASDGADAPSDDASGGSPGTGG